MDSLRRNVTEKVKEDLRITGMDVVVIRDEL